MGHPTAPPCPTPSTHIGAPADTLLLILFGTRQAPPSATAPTFSH
jgi:hypothetical protein